MAMRMSGHHRWPATTPDLHGHTTARHRDDPRSRISAFLRSPSQSHDLGANGVITPEAGSPMLKFQWRSTVDAPTDQLTLASDRSELQVRNLLDDPTLRRAMGLDAVAAVVAPAALVTATSRPEPVLNRRRLLERDAA
jgi:hypothetical protein